MSVAAVGTVIYDYEQVSALPQGTRVRELGGSDREFEVDSFGRLYYGVATTCKVRDLDMPVLVTHLEEALPEVPARPVAELNALRMDDIRFDAEATRSDIDGEVDFIRLVATHGPTGITATVEGRNTLLQLKSAAVTDLTKAVLASR
ncbi:hypothetical protein KHQ84_gp156 [Rhodococcus phage Finch]|uniref:Uncharacterized protein n=1 Tax=Rhodococcus phage Finch TaxID=2094144 RepID=A0A2P1JXM7_9CAUD|nr:hypothetical protein KHQ84_gp156 [Rhodococcus phage Finch]AVO25085.1 hypothetical protein SEA_FINCH_156 [Rhodococcus phage Finch]